MSKAMLFKQKTNWELLAKYVAGETDAKETESVLFWANQSSENKALLQEIKSDWKTMDLIDDRFNVDNAWEKLHGRISQNGGKVVDMPAVSKKANRFSTFSLPVRVAASLILLAILGLAFVTVTGRFQRVNIISEVSEINRTIDLPDGSRVHLNGGTKLSYSKKFGKNNRNVSLSGEAYFEVAPDKENPFRIFAGTACIRVVGTAFNVNTKKSKGSVEVYVESGIVELYENGNQDNHVMLQKGNIGLMDKKLITRIQAKNANAIAWKTGEMNFSDTPLMEVVSLLNNVYNVNITVKGEGIDTIKINGSYQGDPLDDILKVIGQHNPQLTIAKSDDTIYLSQ
jgi:ferric-dicitrate binding protein FerR (iron transport regulator)